MSPVERGEVLRSVNSQALETRMGAFARSMAAAGAIDGTSYDALWTWSVREPAEFWRAIVGFFDLRIENLGNVLTEPAMPGTCWMPGARLSYPWHALRPEWSGPAVVGLSQTRERIELSFDELREQVARCRTGLAQLGVTKGDRVAGYLPNIPETIIAFLATTALGAIWVSCPPEFGIRAVVDRLGQVEPTVLIAIDGLRYGTMEIERVEEVTALRSALPSLRATVLLPYLHDRALYGSLSWTELLSNPGCAEFADVSFDHPLYVLFSSGSTGLPKPIIHGHGGILLEHHKSIGLHNDVRSSDRFFWFSTTGWMMWNYAVSALLHGAAVVCFDGNPTWPNAEALWAIADAERLSHFGASASFLMSCRAAGLRPSSDHDLGMLRQIGSTGSPLPAEGFRWVYESFDSAILLNSASGGTDICSAFVGGSPLLPVRAGEISGRMLGCEVTALDDGGRPVCGEPGELAVISPLPSMPVGLWNDVDGTKLRAAYFDRFPGVWTQGDWVTFFDDGACIISGRSDATLNRGGVRLGTSDFYTVVEDIPDVADSLIVHIEDRTGGPGMLVLFVVRHSGATRSEAEVGSEILQRLRQEMSPRHVPDEVVWLHTLPRTLSGKKIEMPVKKILAGATPAEVVSRDSLIDADALEAIRKWRDRYMQTTQR